MSSIGKVMTIWRLVRSWLTSTYNYKTNICQHHAQLLAIIFVYDNPLDFTHVDVMTLQAISEKLNKIVVGNLKCLH